MSLSSRSMFLADSGGGMFFDEYVNGETVVIMEEEIFKPRPQKVQHKKVTKNVTNNTLNIFAGDLPDAFKKLLAPNGNSNSRGKRKQNSYANGKNSVPKYVREQVNDYIAKMSKRGFRFARNNYEVPGEVEVLMKSRNGELIPKYFSY